MKRSKETWIICKVKYYWAFCNKTTRGLSAILKNIYIAHEHQRSHDAFDVISLSQSAVFPPCPRIDRLPTELNNALRMFVTSLFSSTLVPELRSFRPAPRSQLLDCGKFVFETDNKVLNILFLMPI